MYSCRQYILGEGFRVEFKIGCSKYINFLVVYRLYESLAYIYNELLNIYRKAIQSTPPPPPTPRSIPTYNQCCKEQKNKS